MKATARQQARRSSSDHRLDGPPAAARGTRFARSAPGHGSGSARSRIPSLLLALLCAAALSGPARGYNVYYANLHSHCAYSDGIGTPEEAYTYARDVAHIQVLALTDHTHMLSTAEFNQLLSIANQYTQDGVFVALGAQEFGNLNDFGHINIYDSPYRNPNPSDNLPATYNFIQTVSAFGAFNHPNPSYGTNFENLQFYPQYVNAMRMMEMRNGYYSGTYEPQFIQALNNGWKIGPTANQDNHEGHWGDQGNPGMGGRIYLTGILAENLTKAEILAALRARRFYAMEVDPPSDRIELDFRVDGSPMGSEITVGSRPLLTATANAVNGVSLFNRVELFRDGQIIDTQILIGTTIHYEFRDMLTNGETHYYYVRVNQVDSDQAWSAPVWVTAQVDPADAADGVAAPERLSCAPNPAASGALIRLSVPAGNPAGVPGRLEILDPSGRRVRDLGALLGPDGPPVRWDGRTDAGEPAPAGTYFVRLSRPGRGTLGERFVLIR